MATKKNQVLELAKQDYVDMCDVVDRLDVRVSELRSELGHHLHLARIAQDAKIQAARRMKELMP